MIICPTCGTENDEQKVVYCTKCHLALQPSGRFPVPTQEQLAVEELRRQLSDANQTVERLRVREAELERGHRELAGKLESVDQEQKGWQQRERDLSNAVTQARQESDALRSRVRELEAKAPAPPPVVVSTAPPTGVADSKQRTGAILTASALTLATGLGLGWWSGARLERTSVNQSEANHAQALSELETQLARAGEQEKQLLAEIEKLKSVPTVAQPSFGRSGSGREGRGRVTAPGRESVAVPAPPSLAAPSAAGPASPPPAVSSPPPVAASVPVTLPGPPAFLTWTGTLRGDAPVGVVINDGNSQFGRVTKKTSPSRSCRPAFRSSGLEKVEVVTEPGSKNDWTGAYFRLYPRRARGEAQQDAIVEFYCRP